MKGLTASELIDRIYISMNKSTDGRNLEVKIPTFDDNGNPSYAIVIDVQADNGVLEIVYLEEGFMRRS